MAFEVKIQGKDAALEGTAVSVFPRTVPLPVDDFESNVLVGGARLEADDDKVGRLGPLQCELRRLCSVHEIGIEDTELIPLH